MNKQQVHRLTGNHDYGSFHVEVDRPEPVMVERTSFTTSNSSYGNFIPMYGDSPISLLQTPDALRRFGQQHNFRYRPTTYREYGACYDGWDPLDTGEPAPDNERFTLRQALTLRRKEGVRKGRLPHYPPTVTFTPAPYVPSALEQGGDGPQSTRRSSNNPTPGVSKSLPNAPVKADSFVLPAILEQYEHRERQDPAFHKYVSPDHMRKELASKEAKEAIHFDSRASSRRDLASDRSERKPAHGSESIRVSLIM